MINVTVHSLDTCKCVRVFQWDDSDPSIEVPLEEYTNSRGETFRTIRCPLHLIADIQQHSDTILKENKGKNLAISKLAEINPKISGKEAEVTWSFDSKRNLTLSHPDMKASDMDTIKADLNVKDNI